METLEVVAVIAVSLFAALVAVLIPTLLGAQAALRDLRHLAEMIRLPVLPLVRDAKEAIDNVNRLSEETHQGFERIGVFVQAVEELGCEVQRVRSVVAHQRDLLSANARAVWTGLRSAVSAVWETFANQGGARRNGH